MNPMPSEWTRAFPHLLGGMHKGRHFGHGQQVEEISVDSSMISWKEASTGSRQNSPGCQAKVLLLKSSPAIKSNIRSNRWSQQSDALNPAVGQGLQSEGLWFLLLIHQGRVQVPPFSRSVTYTFTRCWVAPWPYVYSCTLCALSKAWRTVTQSTLNCKTDIINI